MNWRYSDCQFSEHVGAVGGGADVAQQRDRLVLVGDLLVVEVGVADERLPDQRRQEDREEEQREAVVLEESRHASLLLTAPAA